MYQAPEQQDLEVEDSSSDSVVMPFGVSSTLT